MVLVYLRQLRKYLNQTQTPRQVADGLLAHCLKHVYNKQGGKKKITLVENKRDYTAYFFTIVLL